MVKNKISKEALNKIEFIDRNWTRSEYQKLSPSARRLLDQNVNNIFWLQNPERFNARLDPSKLEDRLYINKWLKIRDNVIGETGAQFWEKRVLEDRRHREDARRYSRKVGRELDKLEKSINQPKETSIWKKETEPVKGILREGYTGKGFVKYINETINEYGVDKVEAAFNIVSRAKNGHLINASRDPDGLKGLFTLYKLLISDPDNGRNILQANRVLAAIGSLSEPDKGLLDKPYIFPAQFTLFNSSHITAHQTPEGNIWVKLTQHSMAGHPEGKTLGADAFTRGIELKPHEWVRFKLYDEGGITVCRPAIYLLQLSNKSTKETWSNIINVGSLALPGGPFFRVGGIVTKGGGKLISVLVKLEKAADLVANGLIIGNIAVRENRGWIIKTFPEKGREFIEYFDIAATIATFYGVGKAMTTPVMRKALEKMVTKWDEIKNVKIDPDDAAKLSEIEKSVNDFKAAVKDFGELDDTVKVVQEGAERAGVVDDVAEASAARRQIRDGRQVLEVPTTMRINRSLRDLEMDPDLSVWRQDRKVSSEEFRHWVNNLPDESKAKFFERLKDARVTSDSIGAKRFVLRDAAHEIRMNKQLKEMGIEQTHGDFSGPGSKLDENIAIGLSKNAGPKDPIVKDAIEKHNQGRVHHNPVTADDYLHQALDQYDAVKDPLRAKEGWGYRKSPMTDEEVREIFINNADDLLKKKAMEAVLDWKEKGINPKVARRDYHEFFNRHVRGETPRLDDGGGGGRPPETGLGYADTQRAPSSGGTTKPPIPYSNIEIKYLGEETAEKMAKIGVDSKALDEYLWRLNWEASKADLTQVYLGRIQEGVKKVVVEQVEKSLTLGDDLSRKLVGYGFDPSDISGTIDDLGGKGNNIRQIRESLNNETKLMDYLKDQLCGGQIDDARVRLIVAHGDTRAAIKQKLWENMVENWNKENPTIEPGARRLQQFSEKAELLTKNIEKNLFGSGITGSAIIYQGRDKKKDQETKLEKKEYQLLKKEKDIAKPKEKLKIRESNKKKIQKNLKEKKVEKPPINSRKF